MDDLQEILDALPVPIFFKDAAGVYRGCNAAFERYLGRPRSEIIGRSVEDIAPPDLARTYRSADEALLATRGEQFYEARAQWGDGTLRDVLFSKGVILDGEGRVAGLAGSILDITERKRAEQEARDNLAALHRTEGLLRAISDSTPDPIFVKDRDSRWLFANPAALAVTGKARVEDVLGRTDAEFSPDARVAAKLMETDRRVIDSGASEVLEEHVETPAGRRVYLATKVPYRDAEGRAIGVIGIAQDITERKRLEEQFHEAQKMESIGRLAGGVAHDFNNLLTVVLSCSEALLEDLPPASPAREDVHEIRAAGQRARDLTRQLLAFARRQVTAPVPLDLGEVVRSAEKLVRRLVGADVRLVTTVQEDGWSVRCDPGQVEQVLLNLAANARDAMPGGGTLTLEVANAPVSEADAAARPGLRPGSHVRLSVRDTGTGMSAEVKRHMFEPFFTTKPQGKGTGLGLATVYGIVQQNGGFVLVESEPGRGTTFELYFPRVAAGARPVEDAA